MRDLALVVFFAAMVGTAVSKPLWSTLVGSNYIHSIPEINAQPQYLAAYQNTHSPYYVYNIHPNMAGISSTVYGKPQISHIPAYSFFFGTPIYDFRIPLSPIYPVLSPGLSPGPALPPTSTQEPFDENDYDGIEKLDTKVDPDKETKKPENIGEQDDDSITVEAL